MIHMEGWLYINPYTERFGIQDTERIPTAQEVKIKLDVDIELPDNSPDTAIHIELKMNRPNTIKSLWKLVTERAFKGL